MRTEWTPEQIFTSGTNAERRVIEQQQERVQWWRERGRADAAEKAAFTATLHRGASVRVPR